ncbi:MAG: hypothetical protein AB7W28_03340 [Armatimonadota bacterium]
MLAFDSEEEGEVGAMDIGIEKTDGEVAGRKGAPQIGGHGGLPHSALTREDEYLVLDQRHALGKALLLLALLLHTLEGGTGAAALGIAFVVLARRVEIAPFVTGVVVGHILGPLTGKGRGTQSKTAERCGQLPNAVEARKKTTVDSITDLHQPGVPGDTLEERRIGC